VTPDCDSCESWATVDSLDAPLAAALDALLGSPEEYKPFVVVERRAEPSRVVQFLGSRARALVLDVPLIDQSLEPGADIELDGRPRFTAWGVAVDVRDAAHAVALAKKFLGCLGVGAGELVVVAGPHFQRAIGSA